MRVYIGDILHAMVQANCTRSQAVRVVHELAEVSLFRKMEELKTRSEKEKDFMINTLDTYGFRPEPGIKVTAKLDKGHYNQPLTIDELEVRHAVDSDI